MIATTENPIAAYELAKWINNDASSTSCSPEQFLSRPNDVLSDPRSSTRSQVLRRPEGERLFAEISATIDLGSVLPCAMDIRLHSFNETIGMAIAEKNDWRRGWTPGGTHWSATAKSRASP